MLLAGSLLNTYSSHTVSEQALEYDHLFSVIRGSSVKCFDNERSVCIGIVVGPGGCLRHEGGVVRIVDILRSSNHEYLLICLDLEND